MPSHASPCGPLIIRYLNMQSSTSMPIFALICVAGVAGLPTIDTNQSSVPGVDQVRSPARRSGPRLQRRPSARAPPPPLDADHRGGEQRDERDRSQAHLCDDADAPRERFPASGAHDLRDQLRWRQRQQQRRQRQRRQHQRARNIGTLRVCLKVLGGGEKVTPPGT